MSNLRTKSSSLQTVIMLLISFSSDCINPFPSTPPLPSPPPSELPSLRTLLLHSNQLGLLSGELLSSLPSLEEVSLHSNPLRCDCLSSWGPHLGNQSRLRLLESPLTLCSAPPHLTGRELREVVAAAWGGGGEDGGGGASSCLPHISPGSFPPAVNVSAGQPITLECWADADPAPQFYWVTPSGDKVGGVNPVWMPAQCLCLVKCSTTTQLLATFHCIFSSVLSLHFVIIIIVVIILIFSLDQIPCSSCSLTV